MKNLKSTLVLLLVAITMFTSGVADAKPKRYGAGFVLGAPSALSFKYWQSLKIAYDAELSFFGDEWVLFYGDYLWHFHGIFGNSDRFVQQLYPYIGVGPIFVFATDGDHERGKYFDKRDEEFALGVRIPFGIEWVADDIPLGIGLEIAPGMAVIPSTSGFFQLGISFRYYFN